MLACCSPTRPLHLRILLKRNLLLGDSIAPPWRQHTIAVALSPVISNKSVFTEEPMQSNGRLEKGSPRSRSIFCVDRSLVNFGQKSITVWTDPRESRRYGRDYKALPKTAFVSFLCAIIFYMLDTAHRLLPFFPSPLICVLCMVGNRKGNERQHCCNAIRANSSLALLFVWYGFVPCHFVVLQYTASW